MVTLCTVAATTSGPGNLVDVDARGADGGTGYYLAEVEAETDPGLLVALRPRGGVQRVGLRVRIRGWSEDGPIEGGDAYRVDSWLVGGWRVSHSLGQAAQSASFTFGATNGRGPLGSQMAVPAMLTVGRPWDVLLAYRYGDDGAAELPLLTGARVDSSDRTDSRTITDSINLLDGMFGYRNTPTTVQLPAGHGLTYGQVVRKLWQEAVGVDPTFRLPPIPGDFQFRKEINLIKGDIYGLIAAIGDLCGVHYFLDEDGAVSGAVYAPETTRGPVLGVIDERDIITAVNGAPEPITIRPMPAPPTHVCLEGTIQHTKAKLGRSSIELPSKSYARFAPRVARYRHNSGGSYTDTGATEQIQDNGIRSQALTVLDVDQETVVGIQTGAKGWHNLSAARYSLATNLALTALGSVYVEEQTAGAQAFAWNEERFIDLSFSSQSREFDDRERLRHELQESFGIHHRRAAIQSRALRSTSWEDTTNAPGYAGRLVLGNGEGVAEARAVLRRTELKLIDHDASDDGYRTYRRTRIHTWDRAEGWQYHYGDGKDSSDELETFRLTSDKEEWWVRVPGREDIHLYLWKEKDATGKVVAHGDETRQGALEPAEVRTDLEPNREDYDSAAEWALAVAASRIDVQVMHAEMEDTAAVSALGRARVDRRATYELAQAPWQLERAIRRLFIKGRARAVSFSIPPDQTVKKGQWWRVRYRKPGMDVDHDAFVLDSHFERRGGAGGPIIQRLTVAVH